MRSWRVEQGHRCVNVVAYQIALSETLRGFWQQLAPGTATFQGKLCFRSHSSNVSNIQS